MVDTGRPADRRGPATGSDAAVGVEPAVRDPLSPGLGRGAGRCGAGTLPARRQRLVSTPGTSAGIRRRSLRLGDLRAEGVTIDRGSQNWETHDLLLTSYHVIYRPGSRKDIKNFTAVHPSATANVIGLNTENRAEAVAIRLKKPSNPKKPTKGWNAPGSFWDSKFDYAEIRQTRNDADDPKLWRMSSNFSNGMPLIGYPHYHRGARVKWCVNDSGGDLLPLRDG